MNWIANLLSILLALSCKGSLPGISPSGSDIIISDINEQDTLENYQNLYTGRIWSNKFHRIDGDQFLFANYFLQGNVSINGKTFSNLSLRYDIHNDELMIPVNREEILQLNKEKIDSFSLRFESKTYRFINIRNDPAIVLKGYFNVLYDQHSALYVKYNKSILTNVTDKSDGEFIQNQTTYLVMDHNIYKIKNKNDLYSAFKADIFLIKTYLKTNRLKISKKNPESYVPAVRFYDNLIQ